MILGIGEILCDLICDFNNEIKITGKIGGAPFNVIKYISLLGEHVSFYGIVGNDEFGKFIINEVDKFNNISSLIKASKTKNTTLALISKTTLGNEKYSFYRKNTADFDYNLKKLLSIDITDFTIIHFGSLFLSSNKARKTITEYIKFLKSKNKILSFDVNYRSDIFKNKKEAKDIYLGVLKYFDVIKFSLDELNLLSDNKDDFIANTLKYSKLIIVTDGKNGSNLYYKNSYVHIDAINVDVKGTIGAGDSFLAGVLYVLDKINIDDLSKDNLNIIGKFASGVSALVCKNNDKKYPFKSFNEVNNFINYK